MTYYTKSERKVNGVFWYRNVKGISKDVPSKNKCMYHCLEIKKPDEITICKHNPSCCTVVSKDELVKLVEKDLNLYEILPKFGKRKIYFDIDIKPENAKGDFKEHLEKCKEIIETKFGKCVFEISGNESLEKFSYHIILSNYFAPCNKSMNAIKCFASMFTDYGFDISVYSTNRLMKLVYQSKGRKSIVKEGKNIKVKDSRIQGIIEGSGDISKHFIMTDFEPGSVNINTLDFSDIIMVDKKSIDKSPKSKRFILEHRKNAIDISKIKKSNIPLPFEFDYNNATPEERLRVLPNPENENVLHHDIQFKVLTWCKFQDIHFETFWDWCKKKNPDPSRKERYLSYWNYTTYFIDQKFIDNLLEMFYPKLKRNYNFHRYETLCDTSNFITKKLKTDEWLSINDIDNKKYQIFSVGCGKNKTGTTIDYIKKNPDLNVVIIVPRITLAYDFCGRLYRDGIYFDNYKEIKNKDEISNSKRIIISAESLYRLNIHAYDIVIIDEFETLINTFFSENTHKHFLKENWEQFLKLINDAQKVFIMDAITTLKTINFLKYLGVNDFNLVDNERTIERTFDIITRQKKEEFDIGAEHRFFNSILVALQNGEKCFVFMPYKEGRKERDDKSKDCIRGVYPLMNYIIKKLGLEKGVDIEGYFSEAHQEKRELRDVNNNWKTKKCIITNTCISVGVNYDIPDFDKIFIYYAGWVNPRDIIQVSKRPRYVKNNTMIMYVEPYAKTLIEKNTIPRYMECDIYKNMINMYLIEKNCFCKNALFHLCKKNGIGISKTNPEYLLSRDLIKFEEDDDFRIKYNDIKDITKNQVVLYKERSLYGELTLYEKYELEKYFFKKHNSFNDPDDNILHSLWLGREYIDKFNTLLENEMHVINYILDYNKSNIFNDDFEEFEMDGKIPKNLHMKKYQMPENFIFKDIENSFGQSGYMKFLNGFFGAFTIRYLNSPGGAPEYINLGNGRKIRCIYTVDIFIETLDLYKKMNRNYNRYINKFTKNLLEDDPDDTCLIEDDPDDPDEDSGIDLDDDF